MLTSYLAVVCHVLVNSILQVVLADNGFRYRQFDHDRVILANVGAPHSFMPFDWTPNCFLSWSCILPVINLYSVITSTRLLSIIKTNLWAGIRHNSFELDNSRAGIRSDYQDKSSSRYPARLSRQIVEPESGAAISKTSHCTGIRCYQLGKIRRDELLVVDKSSSRYPARLAG